MGNLTDFLPRIETRITCDMLLAITFMLFRQLRHVVHLRDVNLTYRIFMRPDSFIRCESHRAGGPRDKMA